MTAKKDHVHTGHHGGSNATPGSQQPALIFTLSSYFGGSIVVRSQTISAP
jgi:hypothetical protein